MRHDMARKELDWIIQREERKEQALARLRRILDRIQEMPEAKRQQSMGVLWTMLDCVKERNKGRSNG